MKKETHGVQCEVEEGVELRSKLPASHVTGAVGMVT